MVAAQEAGIAMHRMHARLFAMELAESLREVDCSALDYSIEHVEGYGIRVVCADGSHGPVGALMPRREPAAA